MHSKMLLILAFLFTGTMLFAQKTDHVYLKSGSIIRGHITEIIPNEHVIIDDLSGNTWSYAMSEVSKIDKGVIEKESGAFGKSLGFAPGFVNMTSVGVLAGSSNNTQAAPFSLQMVNGYMSSAGFYAGLGTGIEFLKASHIPAFLDLRMDLSKRDVTPYFLARGGYAFPMQGSSTEYDIEYSYAGGVMYSFGIGLKVRNREHLAWDFGLYYRHQETSYTETYQWNSQESTYRDIYDRIEIRLGLYLD